MKIDKPILEGGSYVIGECNCCHEKEVRIYFFERRYGERGEKSFNTEKIANEYKENKRKKLLEILKMNHLQEWH